EGSVRTDLRPAMDPPASGERYGPLWKPADLTEAIGQIYNTTDMESFEQGGKQDAEWLRSFVTESSTVLDLGCGVGRVALYMAPMCRELCAVDASERMLQLATQRLAGCPNVRLVQSADTQIPVPDDSIDFAYSLLVLQHVEREDAFLLLEELHRVVKPSGRVALTFPNLLSETYMDSFVSYARSRASSQANRARIYTPEEVERVMSTAGFASELQVGTEICVVARPNARPN
ncbi:MAG TPA: hypothetical protein DCQ30_05610, partial [Acidimicrobiaceae bacterium]|nr:hypothetical protein [Acidimicrobiaceae bacterium]